MPPARKTRSSARQAAAAGAQINNNDKKTNRKNSKKRVKVLMDDNSSDDEPKVTKFQVTSVHDGKIFHMWLMGCPNPYKLQQNWECTFLKVINHTNTK